MTLRCKYLVWIFCQWDVFGWSKVRKRVILSGVRKGEVKGSSRNTSGMTVAIV